MIREWLRKYFNLSYSENNIYSLLRASRRNLDNMSENDSGFYRSRPRPQDFDNAGDYLPAEGIYFRTRKAPAIMRDTIIGCVTKNYMEKKLHAHQRGN